MIAILLIIVQLSATPVHSIVLKAAYAITEPNDIQPAVGRNIYQNARNLQMVKPAWQYQPTLTTSAYQQTVNPQAQ